MNEFYQNYKQPNNSKSIELARHIITMKNPVLELKMIYVTTLLPQKKSIKVTTNREFKEAISAHYSSRDNLAQFSIDQFGLLVNSLKKTMPKHHHPSLWQTLESHLSKMLSDTKQVA